MKRVKTQAQYSFPMSKTFFLGISISIAGIGLTSASVLCGVLIAATCGSCPGNAPWCNGDCVWNSTNSSCQERSRERPQSLESCCNCVDPTLNISRNCSSCSDAILQANVKWGPSASVSWEAPQDITASADGNLSLMYVPLNVLKDAPNANFMIAGFAGGECYESLRPFSLNGKLFFFQVYAAYDAVLHLWSA
jgi:hypothetical protein